MTFLWCSIAYPVKLCVMKSNNIGFSLVELLVAVTIATSAIAITHLIYANFVDFEMRSVKKLNTLKLVLSAKEKIINQLELDELSGEVMIADRKCIWQSKLAEEYDSNRFDIDRGGYVRGEFQYKLVKADFFCELENEKQTENFSFKHLLWSKR